MNKILCMMMVLYVPTAMAYLDPGTGSLVLSFVIGSIATCFFILKDVYYQFMRFIAAIFGFKMKRQRLGLVFYSEGDAYWHTFKPILASLHQRGLSATYLTSSPTDPGLDFASPTIECQYIGQGTKAYTRLNFLEADVLAMTTPGLDVFQIKRSKRVRHYTYIQHAPTDGLYNTYSFDYFDSLLCSGSHQLAAIRSLEKLRNLPPKQLFESGCPYFDVLMAQKQQWTSNPSKAGLPHLLIAPTWDTNGLLSKFGMALLEPLAQQGYPMVIRPHPQSFVVELNMIEALQKQLSRYANVTWDTRADNFPSLAAADILISDMSGVIFDYAFVFEKPVITLKFAVDLQGTDANDYDRPLWELNALDQIGAQVTLADLPKLAAIIDRLCADQTNITRIQKLKETSIFHYGSAGDVIAQQLMHIQAELKSLPTAASMPSELTLDTTST